MATELPGWTVAELANLLGGVGYGDTGSRVCRPVAADADDPQGIAFAESAEYLQRAAVGRVGCLIVPPGLEPGDRTYIVVESPRVAFHRLLHLVAHPLPLNTGIHPSAHIDSEAEVAADAHIGPYVVIERGAKVESGVRIYPFCYVGEGCRVGEASVLYPHVVLYQGIDVGRFCILHSGAVLGADGFGFVWDGSRRIKVPQVGGVRLSDEVEVGANTAIDRATFGDTYVAEGTKIDNLVQVGHNVRIGDHSVIAGHVSIGGSSRVGARNMIGGQAALADHVQTADDVMLAGRTGVTGDIRESGSYFGLPAQPHRQGLRAAVLATKLPELLERLRKLEAKLEELGR